MVRRAVAVISLWVALVALSASPAMGQRVTGMDVSEFQVSMNWNTAYAAGARFAYIRVGRGGTTTAEGHQVDANYATYMTGAANAKDGNGNPVTIYTGNYLRARPDLAELTDSHAGSSDDQPATSALVARAKDEAQNLYNLSKPYLTPQHLRPMLDLENIPSDVPAHPGTEPLTQASMTVWANAFLDHFQTLAGIEPLVYVNTDYATSRLNSGINSPRRRSLWIARPFTGTYTNTSQPQTPSGYPNPYGVWNIASDPNNSWDFWQYDTTGNGATYGAGSTNLDLDVFNGSITELQTFLIPEPGSVALTACGMMMLAARRRK
jgi:GH25 family lysozyme M1 (1,4-beta-N-acetylmuramidase)